MSATLHRTEGAGDADRWNAVVQLAHQLDDAAQHITERQAYDFATQFRVLAGIDGEQAAITAALHRAEGLAEPIARAEHSQLMKFYGVDSVDALIAAQAGHIEKLQDRLPRNTAFTVQRVREG